MNPLVNFYKYHQSGAKYWIHYITRQQYNYTRKSWGNHWANESWVTNYLFMSLQWFIHLYCHYTLIFIFRTQMKTVNKTYLVSPKPTFLEMLNITNNVPEDWNGGFGMISSLMYNIHIILQKMIKILLVIILSLVLLQ